MLRTMVLEITFNEPRAGKNDDNKLEDTKIVLLQNMVLEISFNHPMAGKILCSRQN